MGAIGQAMLRVSRACWLAVLAAVVSTGVGRDSATLDDGILDDLSVERIEDPSTDGSVFHEDEEHMAPEDVARAGKLFDVLFGKDKEPRLGESAEDSARVSAEKALSSARKARKKATKALLKAKSSAATKKAKK